MTLLRYLDPDTATPGAWEESAQDPWKIEDPWSRRPGVESAGSSTDSKNTVPKICVSKPTDLQHVVQALGDTVTFVAPPLQLSTEANATVAAINGALAPRFDGIQGQMVMLAGQMTSLKADLVQLSAQLQQHDQTMSDFERQLKDVTAGRSCGSGSASSAASCELHTEPAR